MLWLFIAIGGYILLAAASLIDKFLLSGKLGDPKIYAFYIGILSAGALMLLPFGFWANPDPTLFLIGLVAGAAQIYGCYFYLSALKRLEASRAVPVIGSLVPIFGFFLTALVSGGAAVLGPKEMAGFFLMIFGGWLIMASGVSIKKDGFALILAAAFLFTLNVVLAKLVYLQMPFLQGFLLTAFGSAGAAMTFLFSRDVRGAVFGRHRARDIGQPNFLFFAGQVMGGSSFALQSFAVSLAPQANVPVINAMAGIQYVFIFVFSMILGVYFPKPFKEEITAAAMVQKIVAILLIMSGLAVFALN